MRFSTGRTDDYGYDDNNNVVWLSRSRPSSAPNASAYNGGWAEPKSAVCQALVSNLNCYTCPSPPAQRQVSRLSAGLGLQYVVCQEQRLLFYSGFMPGSRRLIQPQRWKAR